MRKRTKSTGRFRDVSMNHGYNKTKKRLTFMQIAEKLFKPHSRDGHSK